MEKQLESKRNELDEVRMQLQEEKRANKKLDNLEKRQNKERHETKENHRTVTQGNPPLE